MSGRSLHFESIGGASGDMILGALVGLGVSVEELNEELKSLHVDPFEIVVDSVVEQGMSGVRAKVVLPEAHHHHHHPDHHPDHHHGRHLSTIQKLIEQSALPASVKEQAAAVFQRIGAAEAAIHGVDIEKIHFHEVGAMDSIVDIVGCCLALHKLGVEAVTIRSLPQGHGTIECAHGTYPNPAPATLRLLEGFPVESVDEPFELVTPTGAALLSEWRSGKAAPGGVATVESAYSFGHRSLNGRPNLLRASLYEASASEDQDECCLLECNLDDTTPEVVGYLFDQLLEAGALDVFTTAIQMKKQRPGVRLSVLCAPMDRAALLELIFAESTTFGVRELRPQRVILKRRMETMETAFGAVPVKVGLQGGKVLRAAPEFEACRALAQERGVALQRVYAAAQSAAAEWLEKQ